MFMGAWAAYTSVLEDPVYQISSKSQKPWSTRSKSAVDQLPEVNKLIFGHAPPDLVYDHAGMSSFFFNSALYVIRPGILYCLNLTCLIALPRSGSLRKTGMLERTASKYTALTGSQSLTERVGTWEEVSGNQCTQFPLHNITSKS
jgi:hypothetical protein